MIAEVGSTVCALTAAVYASWVIFITGFAFRTVLVIFNCTFYAHTASSTPFVRAAFACIATARTSWIFTIAGFAA